MPALPSSLISPLSGGVVFGWTGADPYGGAQTRDVLDDAATATARNSVLTGTGGRRTRRL
jgi:hypothetical protein